MDKPEFIRIESEGKAHIFNVNMMDRFDYHLTETSVGIVHVIEIYISGSYNPDCRFFDPIATQLWNYLKRREVKVFTDKQIDE